MIVLESVVAAQGHSWSKSHVNGLIHKHIDVFSAARMSSREYVIVGLLIASACESVHGRVIARYTYQTEDVRVRG